MNKPLKWMLMLAGILLLTSCSVRFSDPPAGVLRTETREVAAEGAKSVVASFALGAGELNIQPASLPGAAMRARLTYHSSAGDPTLTYTVQAGEGELALSQAQRERVIYVRTSRNTWDVQLSDALTEQLNVAMGAGNANLKLSGLPLQRAQIAVGAGNVIVDLTGEWENDATVELAAGAGRVEIRLPDETGVEVIVNSHLGGLQTDGMEKVDSGTYRNDVYGTTSTTLHVNVSAGVGEVVLAVAR
jgi:hypothetical protein